MTAVHFHLMVNHFSVFAIPVALVFFIYSVSAKSAGLRRFALIVLVASAALSLPAYFSGEEAEDIVEDMPGFSEELIESHEDAGKLAMILCMVTASLGIVAIVLGDKKAALINKFVIASALISMGGLFNAGRLGGVIRHPEIRNNPVGATIPDYDKDVEKRYEGYESDHGGDH